MVLAEDRFVELGLELPQLLPLVLVSLLAEMPEIWLNSISTRSRVSSSRSLIALALLAKAALASSTIFEMALALGLQLLHFPPT